MAKDNVVDIKFDQHGFVLLDDTTSAPVGSLRTMRNAEITDRGGLAPRPGTLLLGSANSNTERCRGFYNFRRSLDQDELLVKTYDDEVEYLSKNALDQGWQRLKNGFSTSKEFGFVTSLVNTSNEDYVAFCNRYEPYQRWTGAVTQLNGALVGGETAITVDSTLITDIYHSDTASSVTTTTIDVSTTPWAADQWIGFYVLITSGAQSGKISLISDNDNNTLTFATISGLSGTPTFEIRRLAFPASGTLIYNGTTIAYSAVPTSTTFTVSSAHAAADNTPVTVVPAEYPAAPRGNRLTNYLGRVVVGNVRSALARDSGGALQGYSSAGSVFVSKLNDPFDFSFSGTRVAGEGDIIAMPYGGGDITDVVAQEDTFYAFKNRYIESISYSQNANDLAVRDPLKSGIGSIGKTVTGADDVYFFTPESQLTTIGRVSTKDIRPQTLDIGNKIKRYLELAGLDDVGRGMEVSDKVYFPIKSSSDVSYNDVILIYNRNFKIFEGIWDLGAFGIERFNNKYYYASSTTPDVFQLLHENADVRGDNRFAIDFEAKTHFHNITPSKASQQAINGIVIEGYIGGGAEFTFNIWGDFSTSAFLSGTFSFTEEGLLDGEQSQAFMGSKPLALNTFELGEPGADGRRHFQWRQYFPYQYHNYFSIGFSASKADNDFEIIRSGLVVKETVSVDTRKIKSA